MTKKYLYGVIFSNRKYEESYMTLKAENYWEALGDIKMNKQHYETIRVIYDKIIAAKAGDFEYSGGMYYDLGGAMTRAGISTKYMTDSEMLEKARFVLEAKP